MERGDFALVKPSKFASEVVRCYKKFLTDRHIMQEIPEPAWAEMETHILNNYADMTVLDVVDLFMNILGQYHVSYPIDSDIKNYLTNIVMRLAFRYMSS